MTQNSDINVFIHKVPNILLQQGHYRKEINVNYQSDECLRLVTLQEVLELIIDIWYFPKFNDLNNLHDIINELWNKYTRGKLNCISIFLIVNNVTNIYHKQRVIKNY